MHDSQVARMVKYLGVSSDQSLSATKVKGSGMA